MLGVLENGLVFELASQSLKFLFPLFLQFHFILKICVVNHLIDFISINRLPAKSLVIRNRHFWRKSRLILQKPSRNNPGTNIRPELSRPRSLGRGGNLGNRGVRVEINAVLLRELHELVEPDLAVVVHVDVFEHLAHVVVREFDAHTFKSIGKLIIADEPSVLAIEVAKCFLKLLKLFLNFCPY